MRFLVVGAVAVLGLPVVSALGASGVGSVLVGSWIAEDFSREVVIRSVSDRGRVLGWYCVRVRGGHVVTEFVDDEGSPGGFGARVTRRGFLARVGSGRIAGALGADGRSIRLVVRRKPAGRKTVALRRGADGVRPCGQRILPSSSSAQLSATGFARATVADRVASARRGASVPFVGAWAGRRPDGSWVELTVTSVVNGRVRGLYCYVQDTAWRVTDMDWLDPGAIHALVTNGTLTFERRDRRFVFEYGDTGSLVHSRVRPDGVSVVSVLKPVRVPGCASRVVATPGRLWPIRSLVGAHE